MNVLLISLFQDSESYDSGYGIGYAIGQNLPYIIILVLAFFVFRYFKNKSKKYSMDIMSFFTGNGLFLILGIVLIVVYFVNRNKRR